MLKAQPQHQRGVGAGGASLPAAWPLPSRRRHPQRLVADAARRQSGAVAPPPSSPDAKEQQQPAAAWATERLSQTSGSRAAASRAFLSALGVTPTPDAEALAAVGDAATLAARSPFPSVRLPFSDVVAQKKRPYFFDRLWVERDLGYASFFLPLHLFFALAAPLTASPDALRCCALGFFLTGWLGVGLGYHRLLSHRSFRAVQPIERTLALLGALAFEGDPVEWTKMHLNHHAHSDAPGDRHSPRDGFWHAHMGWLFDSALSNARGLDAAQAAAAAAAVENKQQREGVAAVGLLDDDGDDKAKTTTATTPWFVRADPTFYAWLRQNYMSLQAGQIAFFALLALCMRDPGVFVWGWAGRVLITMHATWLVNSASHVWGSQPFETDDDSRDNWLVALLVGGDGWHAGHHAFPRSARHGLAVAEWADFNWLVVKGLEKAGLAWEVQLPSAEMVERKRRKA